VSPRWWRRLRRRIRRHPVAAVAAVVVLLALLVHAGHGRLADPASAAAPPASTAAAGGNVALGQQIAAATGWGSGPQWTCLDDLWTRESGWSNTATNPQSGAYGIAQALGHGPTNQYPAGPANPPVSSASAQIEWGLGYIAQAYGNPCAAWAHEEADGWY
jgi:resuscitation-promoting factor RpfB